MRGAILLHLSTFLLHYVVPLETGGICITIIVIMNFKIFISVAINE